MSISKTAKTAAKNFITRLEQGGFIKDTLPNSFENYTDFYEQADLESYNKFVKTFMYDEYISKREVLYYGE